MPDGENHGARGPAARSRLERLVDVDHPDRSSSFPTMPRRPAFVQVDWTQELPFGAFDAGGKVLSRFGRLADLAWYLARRSPDSCPPTLPFTITRQGRRDPTEQLELV